MSDEDNPNKPDHAPMQLALQIFEDLRVTGLAITESPVDIGFRKNNLFIDVVDLGVAAKRSLNACLYIASDSTSKDGMYSADIEYFKFLTNTDNSNNNQHLKKSLRDAQKAAFQMNIVDHENPSKDAWASVPMIGATAIANGRVTFQIPASIEPLVKDPNSYSYLSLKITAGLTSGYAQNLYERMQQLKFRNGTEWMSVAESRRFIGADKIKSYDDFRSFKRNVLTPAIEQIADISDIKVTYETKATEGTRKITHIKFNVADNPNGKLNLRGRFEENIKELYDILIGEFGLSDENLNEIMVDRSKYNDGRLREVIDFCRARLSGEHKIKWPGLYFMKALRDGLKLSMSELRAMERSGFKSLNNEELQEQASKAEKAKRRQAEGIKQSKEEKVAAAELYFNQLDPDKQTELLNNLMDINKGNAILVNNIKKKGMDNALVRRAMCAHIIKMQESGADNEQF